MAKPPSPQLIERMLTNTNPSVRVEWAQRLDFTPTPEQIERGLMDRTPVRCAWAQRLDFTPNTAQVERGLTDHNWEPRQQWAIRPDFTPTPAQIERGLTDVDLDVQKSWARRLDFSPTPMQSERGLTLSDSFLRDIWASRTDLTLSLQSLNRVISKLSQYSTKLLPAHEHYLRAQAEAADLTRAVELTDHERTTPSLIHPAL